MNSASVHASAGSGKTWLLISRLLRLLLSGAKPDSILAITFTRKAAAEMQQRLLERLRALSTMSKSEMIAELDIIGMQADEAILEQASNLYEKLLKNPKHVTITTFHAFSQQILRRFSLEADIPAGFELVDKTGLLETEAWDALFSEATKKPNGTLAKNLELLFEKCNGLYSTQQALNSFLRNRSDWWALSQSSDDATTCAINTLEKQLDIDPDNKPDIKLWFGQHLSQLSTFAELVGLHDTATNIKNQQCIHSILSDKRFTHSSLSKIKAILVNKSNGLLKKIVNKTARKKLGDEKADQLDEIHKSLAQACIELDDVLARHRNYEINCAWYQAGQCYLDHYQTIKQQQRLLDFTDLEWQASQLLNTSDHAHWIQYKLDQRINHLLIDEFQDTNPTQWRLLLPLLEELAAGNTERQRSVFLVGDAKQSIYRFRRADSQLFSYARDWLSNNLNAESTPLNTSWRSSPAIIDFVNIVFAEGELHTQLSDFSEHSTYLDSHYGEVHVLPIISIEEKTESELPNESALLRNPLLEPRQEKENARDFEAVMLAETIHKLIKSRTVIDDNGTPRPAHYGDIMILLRNRTHLARYELALQQYGVPYTGSAPGTLLSSVEIQDMQALLDTLNTPYNNLAFARVLRSPLFSCTEQDLLKLSQFEKHKKLNWFNCLQSMSTEGSPVLSRAQSLLSSWHKLSDKLPVHDLLDHIYCTGDVMSRFKKGFPAHLHGRVIANLRRFIELALEIDSGRYPSLAQFRARLLSLNKQGKEGPNSASDTSVSQQVNIMTIHSAKGLEAPIVFLADTASTTDNKSAYNAFVDWPSGETQPQLFQLVAKKDSIDSKTALVLDKQTAAQQQEDANLLYVAITRARQYLYISASKPSKRKELGWYGQIQNQLKNSGLGEENGHFIHSSNSMSPIPEDQDEVIAFSHFELPKHLVTPDIAKIEEEVVLPSHLDKDTLNPIDHENQQSLLRGTLIHEIIEKCLKNHVSRDILYPQIQNRYATSISSDEFSEYWDEAINVISHRNNIKIFNTEYFEEAWNEVAISYINNTGNTVNGIIDRLVRYNDELLIIDYKTHLDVNINSLAETYKKQMQYYAAGVKKLWPKMTIRAGLLLTVSNEFIEVEI